VHRSSKRFALLFHLTRIAAFAEEGLALNVDLPVDVRANHFRAHAKRKVRVLAHEIYSSG